MVYFDRLTHLINHLVYSKSWCNSLKSSANQDWYLPVPTYGSTWVVLWLLFCRSAPSTFPNTRSTLQGPFGESLLIVFRLYSEIDHIHLSSEAQCVSHLLPLGDCHNISHWVILAFPLPTQKYTVKVAQYATLDHLIHVLHTSMMERWVWRGYQLPRPRVSSWVKWVGKSITHSPKIVMTQQG